MKFLNNILSRRAFFVTDTISPPSNQAVESASRPNDSERIS
jgi:hypothetical protein